MENTIVGKREGQSWGLGGVYVKDIKKETGLAWDLEHQLPIHRKGSYRMGATCRTKSRLGDQTWIHIPSPLCDLRLLTSLLCASEHPSFLKASCYKSRIYSEGPLDNEMLSGT